MVMVVMVREMVIMEMVMELELILEVWEVQAMAEHPLDHQQLLV